MAERQLYIYKLDLTRPQMLIEGPTEAEAAIRDRHRSYIEAHAEAGTVLLAGRTQVTDERSFGIVVFYAGSTEEAESFVAADPAIAEGLMTAEALPFAIAYHSQQLEL